MARSLRGELLAWLLVPLAGIVVFNAWTTRRDAETVANLMLDRTLLASARVIAEQVKEQDGRIEALIPPSALEMFVAPYRDRVVYRVLAPSDELIAGFPDVPEPTTRPADLQPVYFNGTFRTDEVRAVALAQPVVSREHGGNAMVIVATTLNNRDRLLRDLWLPSLRDQSLLVAAVALLAILGLARGLSPLLRLRSELLNRDASSLAPLDGNAVQSELMPVVEALNQALGRVRNHIDLQRRFVADASHQMRTPLTILKTQAAMGLRDDEPRGKDDALRAIDGQVDALTRLANQLLTLARAEPGDAAIRKDELDFLAITRSVLEGLAGLAFMRGVDLSFDAQIETAPLVGHSTLLRELVSNLVENALRHGASGGLVHVSLRQEAGMAVLTVEDAGPGTPDAQREVVFQRFHRLTGADVEGTGLGLAIVKEIVAAHRGTISLVDRPGEPGLRVIVRLPRVDTEARQ